MTKDKKVRTTTALRNRPLKIELHRLEPFALAGCTDEEIAASLKLPIESLRRDHGDELARLRLVGSSLIRRKTFEQAVVRGDPGMLRLLAADRCALSSDPQLRDLRALQLKEQEIRIKRADLALEEEVIKLERAKLALDAEQQLALQSKDRRELARIEALSPEELNREHRRVVLEMTLAGMQVAELQALHDLLEQARQDGQPPQDAEPAGEVDRDTISLLRGCFTLEELNAALPKAPEYYRLRRNVVLS